MSKIRKIGPLLHDAVPIGWPCTACENEFEVGDFIALVPIGPGDDPEARKRCREGRPYNAVAKHLHWACATGEEEEMN